MCEERIDTYEVLMYSWGDLKRVEGRKKKGKSWYRKVKDRWLFIELRAI